MKKQMLLRQSAMQKTLKYNLDESYAQGYNDAREEIAQQLEALKFTLNGDIEIKHGATQQDIDEMNPILEFCAAIARGQK